MRELKAMVARAVSQSPGALQLRDFPELSSGALSSGEEADKDLLHFFLALPALPSLAEVRSIMTTAAMLMSGGNQAQAARLLGISQPAISRRLNS